MPLSLGYQVYQASLLLGFSLAASHIDFLLAIYVSPAVIQGLSFSFPNIHGNSELS